MPTSTAAGVIASPRPDQRGAGFSNAYDRTTLQGEARPVAGRWPACLIHVRDEATKRSMIRLFFYNAKASKDDRDKGRSNR